MGDCLAWNLSLLACAYSSRNSSCEPVWQPFAAGVNTYVVRRDREVGALRGISVLCQGCDGSGDSGHHYCIRIP